MDCIFPEKFAERMRLLLKDEFEEFEESIINNNAVRAIRVNTDKISLDDFIRINPYKLTKIPYNDDGFYLEDDVQMGGEPCHQAGMFYVQEPSAMIPVNAVDIKPNWKVMDVCAAPGGKTAQISNKLSDEGLLISNDVKFNRCKALIENVERLGLTNVILSSDEVDSLCSKFTDYFDMVLVDATCSGEGMFRKNKNIMNYWSEKKVKSCVEIQNGLLESVSSTVRSQGIIVYSTCTYSIEENEKVVSDFLDTHNEYKLIPVKEDINAYTVSGFPINDKYDFSLMRRFYPHKAIGEGQFVAVLQKNTKEETTVVKEDKNKTRDDDKALATEFLESMGVSIEEDRVYCKNGKFWILPKASVFIKKHIIRYGVFLGEQDEIGIVPDHAFFMAFGNEMNNNINLDKDDKRLAEYLRGNEIRSNCFDGWGVIKVNGCPVGGFYAKSGYVKSYYPKNLTNKDCFD